MSKPAYLKLSTWSVYECGPLMSWAWYVYHFSHHGFSGLSGSQAKTIWSFLYKRVIFHWTIIMVDWVGVVYKWIQMIILKHWQSGALGLRRICHMSHVTMKLCNLTPKSKASVPPNFISRFPQSTGHLTWDILKKMHPLKISRKFNKPHGFFLFLRHFQTQKWLGCLGISLSVTRLPWKKQMRFILSPWPVASKLKQVAAPIYHKMVHDFLFIR